MSRSHSAARSKTIAWTLLRYWRLEEAFRILFATQALFQVVGLLYSSGSDSLVIDSFIFVKSLTIMIYESFYNLRYFLERIYNWLIVSFDLQAQAKGKILVICAKIWKEDFFFDRESYLILSATCLNCRFILGHSLCPLWHWKYNM